MKKSLQLFLISTYATALFFLYFAITLTIKGKLHSVQNFSISEAILLILLSWIAEFTTFKYRDISISTGFAVTISILLYYGTVWAILFKSITTAFRIVNVNSKKIHILNTPFYKTLFNISIFVICIFISGLLYYLPFQNLNLSNTVIIFLRFILLVGSFLTTNVLIISILVSIINDLNFINTFNKYLRFGFLDIVLISPLGLILYFLLLKSSYFILLLFAILILLLRFVFILYIE